MNPIAASRVARPSSLIRGVGLNKFCLLVFAVIFLLAPGLRAQRQSPALTESEIDQLRDSAYVASDRVLVFIKLLDERTKSIEALVAKPRQPGREQDLHDLIEQFTSIADELNDNLDDYGPAHRDMRKALPKLLSATERWATVLKSPADNDAYTVSRKIALEAVRDLREESTRLIEDQKTWFLAHPPPKEGKGESMQTPR